MAHTKDEADLPRADTRQRLLRTSIRIILFWVFLWGVILLGMSVAAPQLLYPFSQAPFTSSSFRSVDVVMEDGVSLPVAVHIGQATGGVPGSIDGSPPTGAPVIFYLMGNYGSRTGFAGDLEAYADLGYSVIAMSYRGGEGIAGPVSEEWLKADALAVYDAVPDLVGVEAPQIHVHGYSLGSGIAAWVAAERAPASVILQASFERMCAVMGAKVKFPACLLPWVPDWNSAALGDRIDAPVLIGLGQLDTLIPYGHGLELARAWTQAGARVDVRVYPRANHVNFGIMSEFSADAVAFIERHTAPR
jgi:dienelactone hydrolase